MNSDKHEGDEGREPYTCGSCGGELPETPVESCHRCGEGAAEAVGERGAS